MPVQTRLLDHQVMACFFEIPAPGLDEHTNINDYAREYMESVKACNGKKVIREIRTGLRIHQYSGKDFCPTRRLQHAGASIPRPDNREKQDRQGWSGTSISSPPCDHAPVPAPTAITMVTELMIRINVIRLTNASGTDISPITGKLRNTSFGSGP